MIDDFKERPSGSSIRRLCRVLGFRRATYYHRKGGHRSEERDDELKRLLHQTTQRFIAWGFWLIFYYLRNQGYSWNHKRVYRVWKSEELHLRPTPSRPKLRREYQALLAPDGINEGWAMDFVSDWVINDRQQKVRIINIMDEGSRKALWTTAHHSIPATKLVEILNHLLEWRGTPKYIRVDNGPEFISTKLRDWATRHQVELKFIQPGKPTQNGLIERLNKTLRKECLDLKWFNNLPELNEDLQRWWVEYNSLRPHKSLGRQTPDNYELQNQKFYFKTVAA